MVCVDNDQMIYQVEGCNIQRFQHCIPKPTINLKEHTTHLKKTNFIDDKTNIASDSKGSVVIKASCEHFGVASNILLDSDPVGKHDGYESKRSRGTGHTDWVVVKLGTLLTRNSSYMFCIDMTFFI